MLSPSQPSPTGAGRAGQLTPSPRKGRKRTTERATNRALVKAASSFLAGRPGSDVQMRAAAGTGVGGDLLIDFLASYRLL